MKDDDQKRPILHTQDNELSHSMVHYLLTIHKLKEERGYARVTDIAKNLDITKGSVSTALNTLKKRQLVIEEEDSKFLNLSELGHQEVHKILTSRTLLFYFLKDFVGVTDEVAHKDSCLMEHLLSDETREKFFTFMKKLEENGTSTVQVKSDLNLSNFSDSMDFERHQMGDRYLRPELTSQE